MSEFLNKIYYGDELEFKIGEMTYFIQGFREKGIRYITVDYWLKDDGTEPPHGYLFKKGYETDEEVLKEFKTLKIFNGKTIYEVEQDITVVFG